MITDAILLLVYYILLVITLPITLLPDVSVTSDVGNAITSAVQYIAPWNAFLPIGTIFAIFGAILTVELLVALYKLIMWMLRRIPTQS